MRTTQALRLLRQLSAGGLKQAASASTSSVTSAVFSSNALPATATLAHSGRRWLSSSAASSAAAGAQMNVQGDTSAVLAELDAVVSRQDAGAKDVADAAMALAFLQARGDRRLWGKIFERASAVKDFDAASITAFLWAATAAGVGHFKTTYELSGSVAKLLPSLKPDQLATVVQALGAAGVNDLDLFKAISAQVTSKAGDMSAPELSKVLYGYAAAGVQDGALTKAVLGAMGGKAAAATTKDLALTVAALAKMGRADNATLSQLSKALAGKVGPGDAPQDVVAALTGFAQLNHKPDAGLMSKASAGIKGAVGELTPEQQVHAAWSLALLGGGDKDVFGALFSALASKLAAAPDAVGVESLALLAEAQVMAGDKAKLPDQVANYALAMHSLSAEAAKERAGAAGREFRAAVATATARAMGARYKPEIAAAVKALPKKTPDGLAVDFALDTLKVAVVPVDASGLSSSKPQVPLGNVVASGQVLAAKGYAPAYVTAHEFMAQPDDTARAKYVLSAIKAAAPGASRDISALEKKLNEPFDPYAA